MVRTCYCKRSNLVQRHVVPTWSPATQSRSDRTKVLCMSAQLYLDARNVADQFYNDNIGGPVTRRMPWLRRNLTAQKKTCPMSGPDPQRFSWIFFFFLRTNDSSRNGFEQNGNRRNVNYEITGCHAVHVAINKFRGTSRDYLFRVGESNNYRKDAAAFGKQPSRRRCLLRSALSAIAPNIFDSATPRLERALAYWMVDVRVILFNTWQAAWQQMHYDQTSNLLSQLVSQFHVQVQRHFSVFWCSCCFDDVNDKGLSEHSFFFPL